MTPGDKVTAYKYLEGNNGIEGKGLFIVAEHASTATPRVTLDASDNVPLLVATLAGPECLWTRGRSTAFMERESGLLGMGGATCSGGPGGFTPHPQPTPPHMHPLSLH